MKNPKITVYPDGRIRIGRSLIAKGATVKIFTNYTKGIKSHKLVIHAAAAK